MGVFDVKRVEGGGQGFVRGTVECLLAKGTRGTTVWLVVQYVLHTATIVMYVPLVRCSFSSQRAGLQ